MQSSLARVGKSVSELASQLASSAAKTRTIEVEHLAKIYLTQTKKVWAIRDITFAVNKGEFVALVGPSGCGKSTVLNIIASFLAPTEGAIRVNGRLVKEGLIPEGLGYIFQKDTVLPWYTVRKNIGLGLRYRGISPKIIDEKVEFLLQLAGLQGYGDVYPHQLSGGMRQRVALLMTLACEPQIVLLDEPFGALDTHTKVLLHRELLDIWGKLGQTIVMVTHDLDEAVSLSDRVIVLSSPPSSVILDHRIDIPRPRDVFTIRETAAFAEHSQVVWRVLGREFKHTGMAVESGVQFQ
jgi:sulfonate transport system ATP-binding protein